MNVHLFAVFAERLLLDNTIANVTRVSILVRKSLFVEAILKMAIIGVVEDVSLAQMPLAGTSALKPVASAFGLFWKRKLGRRVVGMNRINR